MCYAEPKTTLHLHHIPRLDVWRQNISKSMSFSVGRVSVSEPHWGWEPGTGGWSPLARWDMRCQIVRCRQFIFNSQDTTRDCHRACPASTVACPPPDPCGTRWWVSSYQWPWPCDESNESVMRILARLPGYNLINSDNSSHNLPNSSLSFVAPSKVLRAQMRK